MSGLKLMMAWETEFRIVPEILQIISPVRTEQNSFTEEVAQ